MRPETDAGLAEEFEAYLVSADGTVSEEPITDPVAWARAFVAMMAEVPPVDRGSLLEFNADGLASARQHATAAQILAGVDEEPAPAGAAEPRPAHTFPAIDPGDGNGRSDWPGWVRKIRDSLSGLTIETFLPWLAAQQTVISRAPIAQRMLVIKAIHARCVALGLTLPEWVAEQVKNSTPMSARPAAEPSAAAITAAPATVDRDRRWADDMLHQIAEARTALAFDELTRLATTQTVMARLRREKPALFREMEQAFNTKYAELHPGRGQQNDTE
jgi:hypothetical protein